MWIDACGTLFTLYASFNGQPKRELGEATRHLTKVSSKRMERSFRKEVVVAIVLYNSGDEITACVDALRNAINMDSSEIVFIDNESPDEGFLIVQRDYPWATFRRAGRNLGFSGGVNLSWEEAQDARYWFLLNPDAQFLGSNGLQALVDWMDSNTDVAIASPDIIDHEGLTISPARRFPSIFLSIFEGFRLHKLLSEKRRASAFMGSYWTGETTKDADWVPGTAMIIRVEAAKQVGLMSEEFFMYGEDLEWCYRIKCAGWRVGFFRGAKVLHGDSTSQFFDKCEW